MSWCEDVDVGDEVEPYPQASFADHVRVGVDAGVAAIPIVGGSVQVLAEAVMVPSLTKRRETWLIKLGEMMQELQTKVTGFDPSTLAGDEAFVTAVADASRIAMGTHLEAKLNMLKNCLLHMAVDKSRDDFLDLQFFRFVDDLAPEHFVVLQYLAAPAAWYDAKGLARPSMSMGSPGHLLSDAQLPVAGTVLEIVLETSTTEGLLTPARSARR